MKLERYCNIFNLVSPNSSEESARDKQRSEKHVKEKKWKRKYKKQKRGIDSDQILNKSNQRPSQVTVDSVREKPAVSERATEPIQQGTKLARLRDKNTDQEKKDKGKNSSLLIHKEDESHSSDDFKASTIRKRKTHSGHKKKPVRRGKVGKEKPDKDKGKEKQWTVHSIREIEIKGKELSELVNEKNSVAVKPRTENLRSTRKRNYMESISFHKNNLSAQHSIPETPPYLESVEISNNYMRLKRQQARKEPAEPKGIAYSFSVSVA